MAFALTGAAAADAEHVTLTATVTGAEHVTVTRTDPGGVMSVVRSADPATVAGGQWIGVDREAPPASTVTYEMTSSDRSGTATTTVTVPDISGKRSWLKHPLKPWLSMLLPSVAGQDDTSRAARQTILQPLDRQTAVSIFTTRGPAVSGVRLWTFTAAETAAMDELTADGCPLLLQLPAGYGPPSQYVAVGDWTQARNRATRGSDPGRTWTLPYTVVEPPSGIPGGAAGNTYVDLLGAYATYADLRTSGRTYGDVLLSAVPPSGPDF